MLSDTDLYTLITNLKKNIAWNITCAIRNIFVPSNCVGLDNLSHYFISDDS